MTNKNKTAIICVGDGNPKTATMLNLDELMYVRNGGYEHNPENVVHRIEMYFEELNTLLVVEDGKPTIYTEVVNEKDLWTSDAEDRLFTTDELFLLKYNM